MTKKKILLGISVAAFSLVVGAVAFISASQKAQLKFASSESYSITLDKDNVPSGLTASFQDNLATTVKAQNGTDINLNIVNGRTAENNLMELASRGMIYNFAARSGNSEFAGLSSVKATFLGDLRFRTAKFGQAGGVELGDEIVLTSGTEVPLTTSKYFQLMAGDQGARIESLVLKYSCDTLEYDINNLDGEYTGLGSDGYTYKLSLNAGAAVIQSLDMASNVALNGTAVMDSATQVSCAFTYNTYPVTYVSSVSADGQKLTYVSKSGAAAAAIPEINFFKVYNVEDFESYTATGQGWASKRNNVDQSTNNPNVQYDNTGVRAHFYADYYGSNTIASPLGGSGWSLMGSDDFMTYNSSKGRNSSKAVALKGNANSLRYISMNSYYGVEKVIGKGSTFSFWAKGPHANTSFNTNASVDATMNVFVYYAPKVTSATQQTVRTPTNAVNTVIEIGSDWKEYTIPLDSSKIYYGFAFVCKQTGTTYTFIDDIKIYTHSPYAEYVAPVAVTGVSLNKNATTIAAGDDETLVATVAPGDATNKAVTWTSSNEGIATVTSEGVVRGVAEGNATITVTTADGGHTATCAVTVTVGATIYPAGTFKGTVTAAGNDLPLVIGMGEHGEVAVYVSGKNADATGITSYDSSTGAFTIATTGSYSSMTYGNITGTYDAVNHRLTGISCTGGISAHVSNNGSIVCEKPSFYWECDESTSTLQSLFKRRYGGGDTDTGNADRITQNTAQYIGGGASLKLRGYTGGSVRLSLQNDINTKAVNNISYWIYNPSANDIAIRQWVYKAASFGSNAEIGGVTAKAGQWTFVCMGFNDFVYGTNTLYNFQIADFTNSGVYLSFDNICLFH